MEQLCAIYYYTIYIVVIIEVPVILLRKLADIFSKYFCSEFKPGTVSKAGDLTCQDIQLHCRYLEMQGLNISKIKLNTTLQGN